MQHYKCCYCEHKCQVRFHDVEHYRPKARADRGPGQPDYGYWWLAWTWENLLFVCPECNRSRKKDIFPLAPGSRPLAPEEQPPGEERPILIDPASEDPMADIQFRRVVLEGGRTVWQAVARSPRGAETIDIIGLNRDYLRDLHDEHVRETVEPAIEAVRAAIAMHGAGATEVRDVWRNRIEPLVMPMQRYAALAYDVIDETFPLPVRRQLGSNLAPP